MSNIKSCLQECEIERLVLGLKPVQEFEREHLVFCDLCREKFLALAAVYQPLLAADPLASHPPVTDDVARQTSSTLLPLTGQNRSRAVYRLAAQGGQPNESPTVLSFNDSEHGFIARVLRDPVTHHVAFYLLADDMERTQAIKVSLPDADLSGVTDAQGFIDFGIQENFSCTQVRISSPLAVILLKPLLPHPETSQEQHFFTLNNIDEVDIEITITRETAQGQYRFSFRRIDGQPALRELKVVAVTDLRTLVMATEHGVAVLQTREPERVLKIHIY
jgi:hypothetical protein